MEAVSTVLKKTRDQQTLNATLLESSVERPRVSWYFVLVPLALVLVWSVSMFLAERNLRIQKESQLVERYAELKSKDHRITLLVEENVALEKTLKTKIDNLEFTLQQLNDSFDMLLQKTTSLESDIQSKDARISELSQRLQSLESHPRR